jgi:hypothetical protein
MSQIEPARVRPREVRPMIPIGEEEGPRLVARVQKHAIPRRVHGPPVSEEAVVFVLPKIETDVKVSCNAVPHYTDEIHKSNLQENVLLALAFRKLVGANDTCKRNFIMKDGCVFSVDDEAKFVETRFMWSKRLSKDKAVPFDRAVRTRFGKIQTSLGCWWQKIKTAVTDGKLELEQDQLQFVKTRIEELQLEPASWIF